MNSTDYARHSIGSGKTLLVRAAWRREQRVTPTYDQLKQFRDVHVATWNSGDREGFLDNVRQFLASDEKVTMWDPVGTPPRYGLKAAAADPFDMWQPVTRLHAPDETFFICDNEICWVMENHMDADGQDVCRISIENYQFREDGSVHIRTWWYLPDPDSDLAQALGQTMAEYLPDGGPTQQPAG